MKRSSSLISASSSSKPRIEYDVFLSFRGEDTRNIFTCHLYDALCKKGIHTFLDDDKLKRGKSISPELLKAIETSRCSVIVISENYAFSTWCLDELVKILQCMKECKQIVLPIFYHVDPSHVRKQSGSIGEAIQKHEQAFSDTLEKVQIWRDALKEVANLAGSPLRDGDNEAKFIQDFIVDVLKGLGDKQSNISEDLVFFCKRSENLVGMDSRLEKLDQYVRPSSSDGVRFIGICGMGGIGKTTLARAYYNWKSCEFESSSFLANVREVCEKEINGLAYLKNLLLSHLSDEEEPTKMRDTFKGMSTIKNRLRDKKVLIILDDVDKEDQLEELVGEDDWLSSGSRVLVTTRDEGLLTFIDCTICRAEKLNESEGLQLFYKKAFKSSHPLNNFRELCKRAIAYAKGLPLALKVLGSLLRGKTTNEWESAFLRLKEYPEEEIIKVLRITFEELKETEKNIFLDIACFFNGYEKDNIIQIMDGCHFHGAIGIRTLIEKSLISVGPFNNIRMHDLLQEMGKEIVREKSRNEPGRWSRIWDCFDLCHVLDKNTGTEEVEAIVCRFQEAKKSSWEALSNMKKLRLLFIDSFPYGSLFYGLPAYLSNELRILKWSEFPYRILPSSFQPDGLVELILQHSNIEQLWNNSIKPLNNLKIIDLSHSYDLTKFEDFKVVPNLEKLILEHCEGLVEVHPSITLLRRLTLLNLNHCTSLENLPTTISDLESLKVLELSRCESLRILPEDLGNLNSLKKLRLGGTGVTELPSSIASLENLQIVFSLTDNVFDGNRISGHLDSLKEINLCCCYLNDGGITEDFGCLAFLEDVDLSYNDFSYLPACFNRLTKLRILNLRRCKNLKSLGPELPPSLEMVKVDECSSLDTFLDPLNDQYCNLRCSATCKDCFKLVKRQGSKRTAFVSLKRYLQNPPNPSKRFDIVLPGNEIPAWFTHQSSGTSISFHLDPNFCNSKWMGLAISVFPKEGSWFSTYSNMRIIIWFSTCNNMRRFGQLVESPESIKYYCTDDLWLWLFYLPRDMYFQTNELYNNCSARIEFSFENNTEHQFGWGVRLVCEQDIHDLNLHSEDEDLDIRYLLQNKYG